MKEKLTVKITSAEFDTYWYADLVGEQFEVYDYSDSDYVLAEDYDSEDDSIPYRHILKSDAEIMK